MMRIAHIVSTYPPYFGGMGNVVFQIARHLSKLGHSVEVFTPDYNDRTKIQSAVSQTTDSTDFAQRLIPSFHYGNAARLPKVLPELHRFDVVHLHYPFFGTANLLRKWKRKYPKTPFVITYYMDAIGKGWKGIFFAYYSAFRMPQILSSADLLLCSSFDYLESSQAGALFRENPDKWVELSYGVDTERFQPRPKSSDLLNELSLSDSVPILLFVGGMDSAHYFKGVPVLLQALFIAKQSGLDLKAVFVGDGNLRSDYERLAEQMGLSGRTQFVGRVTENDLPAYYNLADLLVLPSTTRGEAFGTVLLESFASGVPVIASDLPGVRTIASKAGMVVSPNDSRALAQTIRSLLQSDNIGLREKARRVSFDYQWEPIIKKLSELYEKILKAKSKK